VRITQQTIAARTYANLQSSLERSARLQDRLSSGRQLSSPSDAPGQSASAMQLRTSLRATEQYVRNADDAGGWLAAADTALRGVTEALQRARDLAVQGANTGTAAPSARQALADEVQELRETVLGLANTTYLGRPVFGGTVAGPTAFDATGAHVGDAGTVLRRVGPNAQVRVDVDGPSVFGNGPGSVFDVLDRLATDLVASPAAVPASIDAIDAALSSVLAGASHVGARTNRVETMKQLSEDQVISARRHLSEVEDVDLPATIVDLQLQEVAYQAALGATARVLQPSLLDFLR
jgi:flagellar hook-associated protein 3 FlgL